MSEGFAKGGNLALAEAIEAIKHGAAQMRTPFAVVIWGQLPELLNAIKASIDPLLQKNQPLGSYHTREVFGFMPKDDPLGPRQERQLNVRRMAMVISSRPIRSALSYMTGQIPWSPIFLKHLLVLIDIVRELPNVNFFYGGAP